MWYVSAPRRAVRYIFPAAVCIGRSQFRTFIAIRLLWFPACITRDISSGGDPEMALTKLQLIGELKHEINSPLAAIRNALYLAATQTDDSELQRYLQLADQEAARISQILKNADQIDENKRFTTITIHTNVASAA
jgi:signal transduction histidine kinase